MTSPKFSSIIYNIVFVTIVQISIRNNNNHVFVDASACRACENGAAYTSELEICTSFQNVLSQLNEAECASHGVQTAIQHNAVSCGCPIAEGSQCNLCPNDAAPTHPHAQPDLNWYSSESELNYNLHCMTIQTQIKEFARTSDTCANIHNTITYVDGQALSLSQVCGCPGSSTAATTTTPPPPPPPPPAPTPASLPQTNTYVGRSGPAATTTTSSGGDYGQEGGPCRSSNHPDFISKGGACDDNLSCDRRQEPAICTTHLARAYDARDKREVNGRGGERHGDYRTRGRRSLLLKTATTIIPRSSSSNSSNKETPSTSSESPLIELSFKNIDDELKFAEENANYII